MLKKGRGVQVLVTGAAGRIGKLLQVAWTKDNLPGFGPIWCSRLATNSASVQWDILTDELPAIPPGAVILHLAGVLRGPTRALAENAAMALKVCVAAHKAGARHVFFASSAAVYGPALGDHTEEEMPRPISDYGRAKLAMERQVLQWSQNAGPFAPKITVLRIGNIVGADALIGQATSGRKIRLDRIAGQIRGPLRSYIGPRALAGVLAQLLGRVSMQRAMPSILNIATQQPVFMADLLDAAKIPFDFVLPKTFVIAKVCLSTARLAKLADLPDQNPDAMIADWQSLSGVAA